MKTLTAILATLSISAPLSVTAIEQVKDTMNNTQERSTNDFMKIDSLVAKGELYHETVPAYTTSEVGYKHSDNYVPAPGMAMYDISKVKGVVSPADGEDDLDSIKVTDKQETKILSAVTTQINNPTTGNENVIFALNAKGEIVRVQNIFKYKKMNSDSTTTDKTRRGWFQQTVTDDGTQVKVDSSTTTGNLMTLFKYTGDDLAEKNYVFTVSTDGVISAINIAKNAGIVDAQIQTKGTVATATGIYSLGRDSSTFISNNSTKNNLIAIYGTDTTGQPTIDVYKMVGDSNSSLKAELQYSKTFETDETSSTFNDSDDNNIKKISNDGDDNMIVLTNQGQIYSSADKFEKNFSQDFADKLVGKGQKIQFTSISSTHHNRSGSDASPEFLILGTNDKVYGISSRFTQTEQIINSEKANDSNYIQKLFDLSTIAYTDGDKVVNNDLIDIASTQDRSGLKEFVITTTSNIVVYKYRNASEFGDSNGNESSVEQILLQDGSGGFGAPTFAMQKGALVDLDGTIIASAFGDTDGIVALTQRIDLSKMQIPGNKFNFDPSNYKQNADSSPDVPGIVPGSDFYSKQKRWHQFNKLNKDIKEFLTTKIGKDSNFFSNSLLFDGTRDDMKTENFDFYINFTSGSTDADDLLDVDNTLEKAMQHIYPENGTDISGTFDFYIHARELQAGEAQQKLSIFQNENHVKNASFKYTKSLNLRDLGTSKDENPNASAFLQAIQEITGDYVIKTNTLNEASGIVLRAIQKVMEEKSNPNSNLWTDVPMYGRDYLVSNPLTIDGTDAGTDNPSVDELSVNYDHSWFLGEQTKSDVSGFAYTVNFDDILITSTESKKTTISGANNDTGNWNAKQWLRLPKVKVVYNQKVATDIYDESKHSGQKADLEKAKKIAEGAVVDGGNLTINDTVANAMRLINQNVELPMDAMMFAPHYDQKLEAGENKIQVRIYDAGYIAQNATQPALMDIEGPNHIDNPAEGGHYITVEITVIGVQGDSSLAPWILPLLVIMGLLFFAVFALLIWFIIRKRFYKKAIGREGAKIAHERMKNMDNQNPENNGNL